MLRHAQNVHQPYQGIRGRVTRQSKYTRPGFRPAGKFLSLITYSYVQSLQRRLRELEDHAAAQSTGLDFQPSDEADAINTDNQDVPDASPAQRADCPPDGLSVGAGENHIWFDHSQQGFPAHAVEARSSRSLQASPLIANECQLQQSQDASTNTINSPFDPLMDVHHEIASGQLESFLTQSTLWPEALPRKVEEHLIDIYFAHANRKYPFLIKRTFLSWYENWKRGSIAGNPPDLWQGFMVHMV